MSLYDHIRELRAELRGCLMTPRERADVEAELARATAAHDEMERALERALAASA